MLCRECNNQNPDEIQYCRHCGAPLGATPAAAPPTAPLPRPPIATRAGPPTALIVVLVLFSLLFVFAILSAMLYPVFARARASAHKATCLTNTKMLALALQMYLVDNNDRLPSTTNWCDVLNPYVGKPDAYVCTAARDLPCGYAFNASLVGASLADVYEIQETVAIFESDRGWNAAGGQDLLPYEPRHLGGNNFGYLDGHATWVSEAGVSEGCIWDLDSPSDDDSPQYIK
jgi:prepilin-type processing-associated H-X9-DG protein